MVSYGVALLGLIVSATLYLHVILIPSPNYSIYTRVSQIITQVAAKYTFVRILSNSRHLQANTVIHWTTWFASTIILGAISFILAEAIPIFNYLIALVGSVCFAPLAMILPGWLWLYDHGHYRKGGMLQKVIYLLHWGLVFLGLFFLVGATYGVVIEIIEAYDSGTIGMSWLWLWFRDCSEANFGLGSAFSCADNSNSS